MAIAKLNDIPTPLNIVDKIEEIIDEIQTLRDDVDSIGADGSGDGGIIIERYESGE